MPAIDRGKNVHRQTWLMSALFILLLHDNSYLYGKTMVNLSFSVIDTVGILPKMLQKHSNIIDYIKNAG